MIQTNRFEISGINRKLQMKPLKWNDDDDKASEVQVCISSIFVYICSYTNTYSKS